MSVHLADVVSTPDANDPSAEFLDGYAEAATLALRIAAPRAVRSVAVSLAFGILVPRGERDGSPDQADLFEALYDAYDAGPKERE